MTQAISTKKCLICKRPNDTLHWHKDPDTGDLWVWCQGRCHRGYSIYEYTAKAGLSLSEFLQQDFVIREAAPNEVQKMEWPSSFVPLYDARAKTALTYLESRGIDPDDNMYYDTWRKGIVFPYFYDSIFCGAQVRMLEPWIDEDGSERKIDTIPGTRLGLLWYNWNSCFIPIGTRGFIVTEGAFNCLAIKQSLDSLYGGPLKNPWLCVAASGSGLSSYQVQSLNEKINEGYKVILAPDSDQAGIKMLRKAINNNSLTHYALTNDERIDWNDCLIAYNDKTTFVKFFLSQVNSIEKHREA